MKKNNRILKVRKRFMGFTLAEVLITLGVVGVVAAITLPSLVNKIEEQRTKSIVKKTVSTLVQANKMARANYDYDEDSFVACVNPETETLKDRKSLCALINTNVKNAKYIPLTDPNHPKNYNGKYIDSGYWHANCGNNTVAYSFPSGAIVLFISNNASGEFTIDVNGKKGPNKMTEGKRDGGSITISYTNYSPFPVSTYTGKPDKFYDLYGYNLRSYVFNKGDNMSIFSGYGPTIWLLTH